MSECPHGYPLVWKRHCPDCKHEQEIAELQREIEKLQGKLDKLIEGLKRMASSTDEFYVVIDGQHVPQGNYAKQLLRETV